MLSGIIREPRNKTITIDTTRYMVQNDWVTNPEFEPGPRPRASDIYHIQTNSRRWDRGIGEQNRECMLRSIIATAISDDSHVLALYLGGVSPLPLPPMPKYYSPRVICYSLRRRLCDGTFKMYESDFLKLLHVIRPDGMAPNLSFYLWKCITSNKYFTTFAQPNTTKHVRVNKN